MHLYIPLTLVLTTGCTCTIEVLITAPQNNSKHGLALILEHKKYTSIATATCTDCTMYIRTLSKTKQ